MIELIILFAASLFLIALFVFWALSSAVTTSEVAPARESQLTELVSLAGVSYEHIERLFDPTDYRFLAGQPRLQSVARQLERDRRRIALLWLRLLRADFAKLERFHRALVACGARTDLRMEIRLWLEGLCFHFLYPLVTLWVRVFGLYTAPRAHAVLLGSIQQAASLLANSLSGLSPAQWIEIKQTWNRHELKISLAE